MKKLDDKWEKLKKIIKEDIEQIKAEFEKYPVSELENYITIENWILERMEELEKVD